MKNIQDDCCIRCGTKVKDFTWVSHFSNAYFFGCPGCYPPAETHYNTPLHHEKEVEDNIADNRMFE